jgi:hypothetical protein
MKSRLSRHIAAVLIFKLLMLTFLGYWFYGVIGKKKFTPEQVAEAVLPPAQSQSPFH